MRSRSLVAVLAGAILLLLGAPVPAGAQAQEPAVPPGALEGLEYRMVGPTRGGRAQAVSGHRDRPHTFYMGTTGGGVWKTTDDGEVWRNVTDGYLDAGSIGAIDVADSDPSVVWAGTGEHDIRGNASAGRGVYVSRDAGKSWSFAGLEEIGQTGDIAVHPRDPDVVWVAALGHAFGPNPERGVYRTTDGGESWEKVLFVSDSTGFVDLAVNPENPREIYAAAWRAERKPWTIVDGAEEGGLFKSTDGGDSWERVGGGLPTGVVGKIGVTVSPADPDRVWAIVAHPERGGVYRSDDSGRSWTRVNRERELRQRAYYYTHIFADPRDPNTVYVENTGLYRSTDAGRSFENIPVPHGDTHDLWIDPERPEVMAIADDGGAQVTTNGGESWSTMRNQPTAQFYRVALDTASFPMRLCGGQQDNSALCVPAWQQQAETRFSFWHTTGGCESGDVAVDPRDPGLIYGGCYSGDLYVWNEETRQGRNVVPYPQMQDGQAVRSLRYRFNWNPPLQLSPHDPDEILYGSHVVHRSTNRGQSWETISPDLTADIDSTQGYPGGPIQHDITGVETYGTVFALRESGHEEGVIWAGSDDGLVHLTRDDGESWQEVTPPDMPEQATVNAIEVSPHDPGTAYVAAYNYRLDDFTPYAWRTEDYGESWTRIADGTRGIPADHATRVVREDPDREGLLYAGTEFGLYVSLDDGGSWQPLRMKQGPDDDGALPVTPITDLKLHRKNLVAGTQGRSFWVLDDLSPLHQMTDEVLASDAHLFGPRDAYRTRRSGSGGEPGTPDPAPDGATLYYWLGEDAAGEPVRLTVTDSQGDTVARFSSDPAEAEADDMEELPAGPGRSHRAVWDLREPGADLVEDAVVFYGYAGGPRVVPGEYTVRLEAGGESRTRTLTVRKDPRLTDVTREDLAAQHELMSRVRDRLNRVHDMIRTIRDVREQVGRVGEREDAPEAAVSLTDSVAERLTSVETELLQTKAESGQDPINFESQLSGYFAHLAYAVRSADARPTDGAQQRFDDLVAQLEEQEGRLAEVFEGPVSRLNRILGEADVPPVATGASR